MHKKTAGQWNVSIAPFLFWEKLINYQEKLIKIKKKIYPTLQHQFKV